VPRDFVDASAVNLGERLDWFRDVQTDAEGKAILIASAMSILERVLFPARPLYFVTAGLREARCAGVS